MGERLGWMARSKESFSVVHRYADVRSQKISPEGKAKVQLQVVTHDGSSTTFHFAHPDGTKAQVRNGTTLALISVQILGHSLLGTHYSLHQE